MTFALTNAGGSLMSSGPTDICKTPAPSGGPVPVPYPNVAQMTTADSGTLSKKVKIAGSKAATIKTETKTSSGDEPGSSGGVKSGKNKGACGFLKGSAAVQIEGNAAVRLGDQTKHNNLPNNNTVGTVLAPSQTKVSIMR